MFKKLLLTLSLVTLSLGLLMNNDSFKVLAYSQEYKYEFPCELNYSVDYINDDGTFSNVECYSDYASAKAKMKENNDYVVRHKNGYSPSRIVAMNSGLVYSYYRGSDSEEAIKIYEGVKGITNNTTTYVTRYFQMEYIDTNYMSEVSGHAGEGYVHINLGGFDGYADLEYTDLVPSKFIDNAIPIYLGGPYGSNSYSPYKTIIEPDYYTVETNGKYNDLVLYYHNAYPDANGKANCWHMNIGSANDFTFLSKGTRYYSPDGINFYNSYNRSARTLIGSGYNYYQYLPLRTKSNITASQLDSYLISVKGSGTDSVIKNKGDVFKSAEDVYGSNAAIIFSMACWESSYGTSGYAKQRNNLFGWRAYDSDPNNAYTFSSVDACINQQAGGNLRDYSDYTVSWFNGAFLGNKGAGFNLKYASDPYWGAGIAAMYYRLDKYAAGNDGNLVDYNKYDLGLVKTFGAPVYADTNASSVYFYCKYSNTRNNNYILTILEDTGSFYKVQLANPVDGNGIVAFKDGIYGYSWSKSVGYIRKSDVTLLTNNGSIVTSEKEHNAISVVDNASINNGTLTIGGIGIITNYDFGDNDDIAHTINVYNFIDDSLVKSITCTNVDTSWYNINDGCNYKYGGFSGSVDLTDIGNGTYYLTLKTSVALAQTVSKETTLNSAMDNLHSNVYNSDTNTYKLLTNDLYNYRFELDITKKYSALNYTGVNKPSNRTSMVVIDNIDFDDNGLMNIKGVGMIYYMNFDSASTYHNLYLVNDSNIYKFNTSTVKSTLDYKTLLNSKYNLDYINFEASLDMNTVESGTYSLVMEINNNGKLDYYELSNDYGYSYASLDINGIECAFSVDSIRSRMLVNVTNE